MTTTKTFSPLQETRYQGLKLTIRKGFDTLFDVGKALIEIRDAEFYLIEHKSFKAFCEVEYGMAEARAYQIMDSAEIRQSLPAKTQQLLSNEGQARELGKVPEKQRAEVLKEAAKEGTPTAAKIKEAAEQIVSPPKAEPEKPKAKPTEPVIECDRFGHEIPKDIFSDWQRAEEIQELLTQLSQIKRIVKNGLEEIDGKRKDVIFAELSNSLEATLGNAYGDLKRVLPWTICPTCSARKATRPKCVLCKQRGWLSKFLYETAVVDEVRSMWEKSKKKS